MKYSGILLSLVMAGSLTGCAGDMKSFGGLDSLNNLGTDLSTAFTKWGSAARTSVSSFDGSKTVSIDPHPLYCQGIASQCIDLGFVWSNKNPSQSTILVRVKNREKAKFHPVDSFKLNIDGNFIEVQPQSIASSQYDHTVSGDTITTLSDRPFNAPISLLERIEKSTSTKFSIKADGILAEGELKNSKDNTRAYHAMLRFLEEVRANK